MTKEPFSMCHKVAISGWSTTITRGGKHQTIEPVALRLESVAHDGDGVRVAIGESEVTVDCRALLKAAEMMYSEKRNK